MFAKTLKIPDKQKNVVLLPCKCTPFEVQKDYIYRVKGLHLNSKRTPFEKPIYNPLIFNAFKNLDSMHFYQYFNTLHSIFNTLTPNSQCIIFRISMHLTHFFKAFLLESQCIIFRFSKHTTHFFKAFLLESQCIIIRFSKHTTPLPTGEGLGVGLCGAYFILTLPPAIIHNPGWRTAPKS